MAVTISDPKIRMEIFFDKTIRKFSDREVMHLFTLLEKKVLSRIEDEFSRVNVQEALIKFLKEDDDYESVTKSFITLIKSELVPDSEFEWLSVDIGAQVFTKNILATDRNLVVDASLYDKKLMNEVYSMVDFLELYNTSENRKRITLDEKVKILMDIKKQWIGAKQRNKSITKWLKPDDVKQLNYVYDYLYDHEVLNYEFSKEDKNVRGYLLGSIYLMDIYDDSIEEHAIFTNEGKKLFLINMRNAWAQQKYRNAGKTKKPYHLPLTKKTNKRLEKMAKVHNTSTTEIIEMLVDVEYERDYLDNKGREEY